MITSGLKSQINVRIQLAYDRHFSLYKKTSLWRPGLPVIMGSAANDAGPPARQKQELSDLPSRCPGATAGYYFLTKNNMDGIVMSIMMMRTIPVNRTVPLTFSF